MYPRPGVRVTQSPSSSPRPEWRGRPDTASLTSTDLRASHTQSKYHKYYDTTFVSKYVWSSCHPNSSNTALYKFDLPTFEFMCAHESLSNLTCHDNILIPIYYQPDVQTPGGGGQ